MKKIYEFYEDFGRMGDLSSIFVVDSETVEKVMDKEIYFGEVLGKHSEIYTVLCDDNLSVRTDDQQFIAEFERIFGENFSTGHSPLDYCYCDQCGDLLIECECEEEDC